MTIRRRSGVPKAGSEETTVVQIDGVWMSKKHAEEKGHRFDTQTGIALPDSSASPEVDVTTATLAQAATAWRQQFYGRGGAAASEDELRPTNLEGCRKLIRSIAARGRRRRQLEVVPSGMTEIRLSFERQEYDIVVGEVPEKPSKPSTLCLFGDGKYLLRENKIGRFFRKLDADELPKLPSLKDGPSGFFKLNLPKIPYDILRMQVAFYRAVMVDFAQSEAYTLILWDKEEKKYVLHCPVQRVSGASVDYVLDLTEFPSARYFQVASCHSHNSMGAFFSGTDDGDEKGDMIYFVMGQLDKKVPAYKIRASVKGKQICFLELSDVFQIAEEEFEALAPSWITSLKAEEALFPLDWLGRVTEGVGHPGAEMGAYALQYEDYLSGGYGFPGGRTAARTGGRNWKSPFSPHPFPKATIIATHLEEFVTALKAAEPKTTWHAGRTGHVKTNAGDVDFTLESQAIERFLFGLLREGFEDEFLNAIGEYVRIEEEPTVPPAEVVSSTELPADINVNSLFSELQTSSTSVERKPVELVFVDDGSTTGALVAIGEPGEADLPLRSVMTPMTQGDVDSLDSLSPEDFLDPDQFEVEACLRAEILQAEDGAHFANYVRDGQWDKDGNWTGSGWWDGKKDEIDLTQDPSSDDGDEYEGLADADGNLSSMSVIDLAQCEIASTPSPFDKDWNDEDQ